MLETKNTKVQEILKEIHRKVHQKAGRMDRMSKDIVLENIAVQALCSNMKLSPAVGPTTVRAGSTAGTARWRS